MNELKRIGKKILTDRLSDQERFELLQQYEKLRKMDWIDISKLPAVGCFYFLVDGGIVKGNVGEHPTATKFAPIETTY